MPRVFQWTQEEDDIASDAVTVGISSDSRILTVAGIQFGEKTAVVFSPDWRSKGEQVKAGIEGPMTVEAAFTRAETMCSGYGFKRVTVWLQHRELWDSNWGKLALEPGL